MNATDEMLLNSVKGGDTDNVILSLNNGANVNIVGRGEASALMHASIKGYLNIVKILIENGADINMKTNTNALIAAAGFGYLDIVKYLVDHGADVNSELDNGETASKRASTFGETEVVNYLNKYL